MSGLRLGRGYRRGRRCRGRRGRGGGLIPASIAPEHTGAGIVIALVDSGINFDHPHLRIRGRAWTVAKRGVEEGALDRFGHGTCCGALIHHLAPGAELWAINVVGDRGTTDSSRLAAGIVHAVKQGAGIICVPLGTPHRTEVLDTALEEVEASGAVIVAADPGGDREVWPAAWPGGLAVGLRDGVDVVVSEGRVWAEGKARAAPGHPVNFYGPSLSAARASAALARFAEASGEAGQNLLKGFKMALPVL